MRTIYELLSGGDKDLVTRIVRRDLHNDYYAANDEKHFKSGLGSTFTDPRVRCTEDVVGLALIQRGSLLGDDRSTFVDHYDADPGAFSDGCRYLLVSTPGVVGVEKLSRLDNDMIVHFESHKPSAHIVPVVHMGDMHPLSTNVAVVILGPDPESESGEMVFTTYPGTITPAGSGEMDSLLGASMSVEEMKGRFGPDVHVNIA